MVDHDQGGLAKHWVPLDLGPSIGWALPLQNTLAITAPGTYTLDPSTTLVNVNVAGAVAVVLPSATNPSVSAMTLPGRFANSPITIVDVGGNANFFPITIAAAAGETVIGFASIQLNTKFGGYTLLPNSAAHGWNAP